MITDTIDILNIKVDPLTVLELHDGIMEVIRCSEHALVLNVNVHCMNLAYEHSWLKDFLNAAEIVFCDGAGIMLGARILGSHIPERITYADWIWQLAEFSEAHDFSMYFLGGRPGVAEEASRQLQKIYPKLNIVGIHHGYFDKSVGSDENQTVIHQINELKPNILVTAFGMPLQEKWLMENWSVIDANVALTGGAVFDYISGDLQRAPKWMTNNGFEWLGRMLIEPKRLWRRYIVGNPVFLWRVAKQRFGFKD